MARVFNEILRHLPTVAGYSARRYYLRRRAQEYGDGSLVGRGSRVLQPSGLTVGKGVVVARDVTLDARGGLYLDDEALIGFDSILLTETHRSDEVGVSIQSQGMYSAPVRIGARAWLGMRVLVLPGVEIGEDSIVASGAVVTRSIPSCAVAAGMPARVIGMRDASEPDPEQGQPDG